VGQDCERELQKHEQWRQQSYNRAVSPHFIVKHHHTSSRIITRLAAAAHATATPSAAATHRELLDERALVWSNPKGVVVPDAHVGADVADDGI